MTEAELLLADLLNCSRPSLYLNRDARLNKNQSKFLSSVLKRRAKGEPLQYILAKTEFMGLEFKVTEDVFIGRPETEVLVETAIRHLSAISMGLEALRILDLGTGSGCIAVSLAKLLPNSAIDAIDISNPSLKVAKRNAELNKVNINFMQSDLFNHQKLRIKGYDMIISNPPYIPTGEIRNLQPEVSFEPFIALDGGSDGLDFYRRIIEESSGYLKENGYLMMEIGFNQRYALEDIIGRTPAFSIIEVVRDYSNLERVIVAQKLQKWTS